MFPDNSNDLEQKRIEAEIRRNEAEEKKLLNEAEEIKKRLDWKFLPPRIVIQAVLAGIVAAGLLAAWGIGYLKPIILKNNELATLENKILASENKNAKELNEAQRKELEKLNEQATNELKQLKAQNSELQQQQQNSAKLIADLKSKLEQISVEYKELSENLGTTETERTKYKELASATRKEIDNLKSELDRLQIASTRTKRRSQTLSDRLITAVLADTIWTLYIDSVLLSDIVFKLGGVLEVLEKPHTTYRWFVKDSKITLERNDGNSIYESSKVEDIGFSSLKGRGFNRKGLVWDWTATLNPSKK